MREYCSFKIIVIFHIMTEQSKNRFFELLQPVRDRLVWHIFVMTKDEDEARDIAEDAMLLAYDNFDTLRNEASFEFFLFRIARREFIRTRRRKKLFIRLESDHESIPSEAFHALETGYDVRLLLHSISILPQRQRETISLYKICGFTMEEIRNMQGGTLSGVKTRLVRARRALEIMLNDGEALTRQKCKEMIPVGGES